jgi:hypothetical protein
MKRITSNRSARLDAELDKIAAECKAVTEDNRRKIQELKKMLRETILQVLRNHGVKPGRGGA